MPFKCDDYTRNLTLCQITLTETNEDINLSFRNSSGMLYNVSSNCCLPKHRLQQEFILNVTHA